MRLLLSSNVSGNFIQPRAKRNLPRCHLFTRVSTPSEGTTAPEIELPTDTGEPFRLSSLQGKNVVLYFYPKADTPGCTKESCDFAAGAEKFSKANTVIVGVSPDRSDAQAKFKSKFNLPNARCPSHT